jgi:O-succinylbenzoate synthase
MKIWVHPYKLIPRIDKVQPRIGALVKVEWALHQTGYSDLHPWPEFGERPLDVHIDSLAKVDFTKLAEISMEFNYIDREFRIHKRNAFLGMIMPRSHRLVHEVEKLEPMTLNKWAAAGVSHIKVKMGVDLKSETEAFTQLAMSTSILWRLDFNGRLSGADFTKWWKDLDSSVRARIDFIEDPLKDEQLKQMGPWADDWFKQKHAKVKVVKPAREAAEELVAYDRVVFTHGLDHSIGQACACWSAADYYGQHPKKTEVCGLAAPEIYEPDDFSRAWSCEGPRMKPTPGTGFGFDELLEKLKWERIL